MSLIKCPECAGQVSDKAGACPHCGFPTPEDATSDIKIDHKKRCPHCGSTNLDIAKRGANVGLGIAGGLAGGLPGIAAGSLINSGDMMQHCLACGRKWKASNKPISMATSMRDVMLDVVESNPEKENLIIDTLNYIKEERANRPAKEKWLDFLFALIQPPLIFVAIFVIIVILSIIMTLAEA